MTPRPDAPECLFCGEPEHVSLLEVWDDHSFQLATCCDGLLEQIAADIADDPAWGRELLLQLGAEELTGIRLRRVMDGQGSAPILDGRIEVRAVDFATARAFIARHHGHCSPPRGWRFGASVWNGWTMMGLVTVGNPVAPALNGRGIVEVNRLCIRRDVEPMLRWNCCSKLYAWSAAEAERRGFGRIISYTREDEDGASLRAAGWTCEGAAGGRGWHSARRARSNVNAWIGKVRWSRTLRPKPVRPAQTEPPVATVPDWMRMPASTAMPWGVHHEPKRTHHDPFATMHPAGGVRSGSR